jgi:squalene cyclase
MTPASEERARAAALAWLETRDAPESVIALHEAGAAADDQDARRWVRRLVDEQDPDGSWNGDLMTTAATLMTLGEIRMASGLKELDPGIGRALDWLRGRRRVPGSWSDACSPDRHRRGLCHHFLGGFFSPGPPESLHDEATLRSGVVVAGDAQVRFVASTTALRCLLQWADTGTDVRLHLEGLRRLVDAWEDRPPEGLTAAALLAAIHALLLSPDPDDREAADRGLRVVAGKQRGDGSWVEADPFHALEVFGAAARAGVAPERSRKALWHGARLLVSTQNPDGSWGGEHGPRRALLACRTLGGLTPAD